MTKEGIPEDAVVAGYDQEEWDWEGKDKEVQEVPSVYRPFRVSL